jgi:hypothetical protein
MGLRIMSQPFSLVAETDQSVYKCAMDWTAGFSSQYEQEILLHSAQTDPGAHPASNTIGTGWLFLPRGKVTGT